MRARTKCLIAAAVFVGSSCTENLPSGPTTFAASIRIVVPHDTVVVGDSSAAQAQALDTDGHAIQGLTFTWATADATILDFATPPAVAASTTNSDDATSGRTHTMVGKKPGRSVVTLTLPDPRFSASNTTRTQTVVVGGVRILSTHDSTLTAVNDTGRAIAAGLVRSAGSLVTRASQGIRWTHLGVHTTTFGAGDTIRYIAKTNGADTLIASHDFCLALAKCADTAVVHVSQQLALTLSGRTLAAWSFSDSLAPTVTFADRRGNGLPNSSIRFVPAAAADSSIVTVAPVVGTSNFATGVMATPRLVSTGNGAARVFVQGLGADNSIVAVDSLVETVRQVARRVAVEPLRAVISRTDSIPTKAVARDAHGATIADATITVDPVGISMNGIWAGPTAGGLAASIATITPTLTGIALPSSNPAAPQFPPIIDVSQITILSDLAITDRQVTAGTTSLVVSGAAFDSIGQGAVGRWVRFGTSFGIAPDSVPIDVSGLYTTVWTPPDSAATYTLTGVRGAATPLATLNDSAGRVVYRRTVTVVADIPSSLKSTIAISATTIAVNGTATVTVRVKDRFGNPVKTATPADFVIASGAGAGTFSGATCSLGVCTVTYTAPAAPGPDMVSVKIGGLEILFSPIALTIQ